MEKPQKIPKLVTIAVLTVITVVFWIGFGIYRVFTQTESEPPASEITLPLSPTLDQGILGSLQSRLLLTEGEIGETILPTNEATPSATTVPESTPEAIPEATQSAQATGSAETPE